MSYVQYELAENKVATLTIDRQEALNALNEQVLLDLDAALDQVQADRARAVIVTGAGSRSFVAGADVVKMSTMTQAEALAFSDMANRIFLKLERLPMPTVAAVNGWALGGGCELACACDIRLASEKAAFGQPEAGLGIPPGFGGTQRLVRVVTPAVAKEMIYTTRRVKADRALAIGLVNAVYAPEELLPAAQQLAGEIAAQGPIGVRAAKRALTLGTGTDMATAVAIEAAQFAACFGTADQREAMTAFAEKREHAPFEDR